MKTDQIVYHDGDTPCHGYLAYDEQAGPRPVVLVSHAWAGQGDFEREKAHRLVELGYTAFALDNYGHGKCGNNAEDNSALMGPHMEDRFGLQKRLLAGLEAARGLEPADGSRVGAIGYCFGGLCALDLARSGADVRGVVSFHGLFAPSGLPPEPIRAKVLALHGHDDPMVPPDKVLALQTELTEAGADWQVHAYGGTVHAFTNPAARAPEAGTAYRAAADRRSWQSMTAFLAEALS